MTIQPASSKRIIDKLSQWITSRGGRPALAAISSGLVLFSLLGWALSGWKADGGRPFFAGSASGDLKITPPAALEELASQFPKWSQILSDPKLDSIYREFLGVYQQGGEAGGEGPGNAARAIERARRSNLNPGAETR